MRSLKGSLWRRSTQIAKLDDRVLETPRGLLRELEIEPNPAAGVLTLHAPHLVFISSWCASLQHKLLGRVSTSSGSREPAPGDGGDTTLQRSGREGSRQNRGGPTSSIVVRLRGVVNRELLPPGGWGTQPFRPRWCASGAGGVKGVAPGGGRRHLAAPAAARTPVSSRDRARRAAGRWTLGDLSPVGDQSGKVRWMSVSDGRSLGRGRLARTERLGGTSGGEDLADRDRVSDRGDHAQRSATATTGPGPPRP